MVEEITIRVSGRVVERVVWIIIVLILLIALIWTNVGNLKESSESYRDQISEESSQNTEVENKEEETNNGKEEASNKEAEPDNSNQEQREVNHEVKDGEISIYLTAKPIVELRGSPDNRYMRATVFSYEINNGLKDFKPKVYLYIYDEDDDKETYKEVIIYEDEESRKGELFAENERISLSFNEVEKDKTIELELYDEDDKLLDTYTEVYNFATG